MNRVNIEQYHNSLGTIIQMHKKALINDKDFKKAESYLVKKYCIKIDSLYRSNYLINNPFRAIYIVQKKEGHNGTKDSNENRCITTIRKEN